jgi:tetratricopeptide (TPR) repeat protein
LIFTGAGIIALLLTIAAILHNDTSPGNFTAQNRLLSHHHLARDLKVSAGERAGSFYAEGSRANLNTGASKNLPAPMAGPNHPLTYENPLPPPQITQLGDGKPRKPRKRSILSLRLSKDGARLLSVGNYDDAIKTFQTALVADPGNPNILGAIEQANKAKAAEQATAGNQTNKSIEDVNGSVGSHRISTRAVTQHHEQTPESTVQAQDALQVGRKLLALGNYDEAIKAFRAGLTIDPQNEPLRTEMARARSAQIAEEQVLDSP